MKRFLLLFLSLALGVCAWASPGDAPGAAAKPVIDIGSRLELFIDDFLIERLEEGARQRLHHPVPREVVMVHDAPWEGNSCGYYTVFRDGDLYRMYYRASHWVPEEKDPVKAHPHPDFFCYAESDDGIHWRKPAVGLYEFRGSKENNILLVTHKIGETLVDVSHGIVFKDTNPDASADARYKAFFRAFRRNAPAGLIPFKSPDGIHWSPMADDRVLTSGRFDSQNVAFWDSLRGEYRAYWRYKVLDHPLEIEEEADRYLRAIRTGTSQDFLFWTNIVNLYYGEDAPEEHLYTNVIKPYYRAPHLYLGFPVRYVNRLWSESMRALPDREIRERRARITQRLGTALTESLIMVSRDGVNFKRWEEAFLRPGIERPGTWNYGQQFIAWHLVETRSSLEGAPNEISLYATEDDFARNVTVLRRYTIRLDGFVSIHAPMSGGEIITRPLTFSGSRLVLNFSTSAAGEIRVEIQDESGHPLPGYALDDCPPIFGDSVERAVVWVNGSSLAGLQGRTVRLKFVLKDADLYALRFK